MIQNSHSWKQLHNCGLESPLSCSITFDHNSFTLCFENILKTSPLRILLYKIKKQKNKQVKKNPDLKKSSASRFPKSIDDNFLFHRENGDCRDFFSFFFSNIMYIHPHFHFLCWSSKQMCLFLIQCKANPLPGLWKPPLHLNQTFLVPLPLAFSASLSFPLVYIIRQHITTISPLTEYLYISLCFPLPHGYHPFFFSLWLSIFFFFLIFIWSLQVLMAPSWIYSSDKGSNPGSLLWEPRVLTIGPHGQSLWPSILKISYGP